MLELKYLMKDNKVPVWAIAVTLSSLYSGVACNRFFDIKLSGDFSSHVPWFSCNFFSFCSL